MKRIGLNIGMLSILCSSAGATPEEDRKQEAAFGQAEAEASAALDRADEELRLLRTALREGEGRLENLSLSVREIEGQKRKIDAKLLRDQEQLKKRLRARFLLSDASVWSLLLSSEDPAAWTLRQSLLDHVLKADLRLIAETRLAREDLKEVEASLRETQKKEKALRTELEGKRKSLQAEREKKQALLEDVRSRQAEFAALIARREKRRAALQIAERAPENQKNTAPVEPPSKGKLIWPAQGPIRTHFGAPLAPGSTARSKGLEIVLPIGTPLKAAATGKVIYSGWYNGYGNLVIIDHGEGIHSLYGHLDAINRVSGEIVQQGTQIGESGDSGSLSGPILYFELRQKGRPQNPISWLSSSK